MHFCKVLSEGSEARKKADIMARKLLIYMVSVLTLTAVMVFLNKMVLLAVDSVLPVGEATLDFYHTIFSCISAVISIFYGLAVVSATTRNDK